MKKYCEIKKNNFKLTTSGFTLLELLGVIIIITLLTLLIFPNIVNSIRSSKGDVDNLTMDLIDNATGLYMSSNTSKYDKLNQKMKYQLNSRLLQI